MAIPEEARPIYQAVVPPLPEIMRFFGAQTAKCWVCNSDEWGLRGGEDGQVRPSFFRTTGEAKGASLYHIPHLVVECLVCHNLWLVSVSGIRSWLNEHPAKTEPGPSDE